MRQTPLPLLRDLEPTVIVQRCAFCHCFAIGAEVCQAETERRHCRPRLFVEHYTLPPAPVAARMISIWRIVATRPPIFSRYREAQAPVAANRDVNPRCPTCPQAP
jgi:hypothetical protein